MVSRQTVFSSAGNTVRIAQAVRLATANHRREIFRHSKDRGWGTGNTVFLKIIVPGTVFALRGSSGVFPWRRAKVTCPRQIIDDRCWLVTRRCIERKYLLRPDDETNSTFAYCLAEAAKRTQVEVMGYVAMSNHYHAVVRDPSGQLPKFLEHLNKFTARVLNKKLKRKGSVWEAGPAGAAYLVNDSDVLGKLIYTLANPVAAHLVDRVADWPGACSYKASISTGIIEVDRPNFYFRKKGKMPERNHLTLSRPPGFAHLSDSGWGRYLEAQITCVEDDIRAKRIQEGKTVLGRQAVLAASPFDTPKTPDAPCRMRPAVACLARETRIQALKDLQTFRHAHEAARRKLEANELDALFPYGTYKMRLMGLLCAGPP